MNVKDELKKVIEGIENTMAIMDRYTFSGANPEWAKGAWNALDIVKPKLEAILDKLIKEDVPYEDRPR